MTNGAAPETVSRANTGRGKAAPEDAGGQQKRDMGPGLAGPTGLHRPPGNRIPTGQRLICGGPGAAGPRGGVWGCERTPETGLWTPAFAGVTNGVVPEGGEQGKLKRMDPRFRLPGADRRG